MGLPQACCITFITLLNRCGINHFIGKENPNTKKKIIERMVLGKKMIKKSLFISNEQGLERDNKMRDDKGF